MKVSVYGFDEGGERQCRGRQIEEGFGMKGGGKRGEG